jgi:hypothetical protein
MLATNRWMMRQTRRCPTATSIGSVDMGMHQ